jgi:hypothetical protein
VEGAAKEDVGMNMICPDTPAAATINDAIAGARPRLGVVDVAMNIVWGETPRLQFADCSIL